MSLYLCAIQRYLHCILGTFLYQHSQDLFASLSTVNMDALVELSRIVPSLQKRIDNLRAFVKAEERIIIALAGVPGSGKSTISGALVQQLRSVGIDDVVVVPMVRLAMA